MGHTLRKPMACITRQALIWNPQGQRKRSRQRNTRPLDLKAETKRMGYTFGQLDRLAQDRDALRALVDGLRWSISWDQRQWRWWWYNSAESWTVASRAQDGHLTQRSTETVFRQSCYMKIVTPLKLSELAMWSTMGIPIMIVTVPLMAMKWSGYRFVSAVFIYLFICLFVCVCVFIHLFIYLFIYLFVYSFIRSFIYLFIPSFMHLIVCFFVCLFACHRYKK